MSTKNIVKLGLTVLFLSLVVAGVPTSALAQEQPRYGGTMVIGRNDTDPAAIGFWTNPGSRLEGTEVFNGLVAYDANYDAHPDLADSWEFSADMLTWTFHLHHGVLWHDGIPFTSADVKYTYEKLVGYLSEGTYFRTPQDLKEITTPDDYTVVFHWQHPYLEAFYNMGVFNVPIGPKHLYEGTDPVTNKYNVEPIGTGPFKFKEWVKGDHITLVKNENYFKPGLPYLDQVIFRFIPDSATFLAALKAGEIDFVPEGIPLSIVSDINKMPEFSPVRVSTTGIGKTVRFLFNWEKPMFQDVRVREAFSLAIDRQVIIDKAAHGYGEVSKGPYAGSALAKYKSPNVPYPKYDPAAAEKLLDEAGYPRKTGGVRFTLNKFLIVSGSYSEVYSDPAYLIKDMLHAVGIETKIVAVDLDTQMKMIFVDRPRGFDVAMHWGRAGPTPLFYRKDCLTEYIQPAIFTNTGYSNPEVDKLYGDIAVEPDQAKAVQMYHQIDEILARDFGPELFIYDYAYAQARKNSYKGFTFYEVIPEGGPSETIWWTQGTLPAATTTSLPPTTTTLVTTAPAGVFPAWELGAVIAVIVILAAIYLVYRRSKKK